MVTATEQVVTCKHAYPSDTIYCKKCGLLSQGKAMTFIAGVLKDRRIKAKVTLGAGEVIVIDIKERPNAAAQVIENLRKHILTKVKKDKLVINE